MTAYYNEFDPKAAAWLRELIRCGLIADGVVDERSILDVQPADLAGFTQCHFFAGVGGWSLALRLAGWPDSRPVWTGSPPCQPFSAAGRQLGKDDERHLAPHFASLVAAGRPGTLFGEQVASAAVFGKATGRSGKPVEGQAPLEWAWLDDLFERLEAAHYACGASDIPAAGVGAAHIRQRTFFGAQRLDNPAGPRHDGPFAGPEGLARNETWLRLSGAGSRYDGLADTSSVRQGVGARCGSNAATARNVEDGTEQRQRFRYELSAGSGSFCGMADAERLGPPAGLSAAPGRHGGVADVAGDGGYRQSGFGAWQPGAGGLADTLHTGRPEWRAFAGSGSAAGGGGGIGGVADAERAVDRRQTEPADHGRPETDRPANRTGRHCGPLGERPRTTDLGWLSADWLYCRDGKWRPVEPGTFPLAHGVSARVGRLRGYGNAIVPQAAAEFIKAFDAASAECFRLNEMSEMATDNGVFG